jgi:hypothetical protein
MLKEVGVSSSSKVSSSSLAKQRGFVFRLIHSLFTVALVVGLVVLYKAGKLPFINYRPNLSNWHIPRLPENPNNNSQQWEESSPTPTYIQARQKKTRVAKNREETIYTSGRYAVQVAAGYDSRQLYGWRNALVRDGFDAYLVSLNTSQGLLLKLRVGAYTSRAQAEKTRDLIKNRYPEQGLFTDSFVITGD